MDNPNHPLQGVALFMAEHLLFAFVDTTNKYFTTRYNMPLIIIFD